MSRRKRYSSSLAVAATAPDGGTALGQSIGVGSRPRLRKGRSHAPRIKPHEMTFVLQHLATLVDNGVPLPRALGTLAKEDALSRHHDMLRSLRRQVEGGVAFSTALASYPNLFDAVTLSQIRVGERSGTLVDTFKRLAASRNRMREIRRDLVKKLAYPLMLTVIGSGLIAFLLLYVIPVFEKTYADAGVELPWITQCLIFLGGLAQRYVLWAVAGVILAATAVKQIRKNGELAARMDRRLITMPWIGKWLRDIAVLQVMDVLNNLLNAGFTLADALHETADSVGNRAVARGVRNLHRAVQRGERFSRELENQEGLFPPLVHQLVLVGESTGRLADSTQEICEHLRSEIERKTSLMVGALEPLLTIALAIAIAVILLAIYLPMFDMVHTIS